jgi:hypothetical protein
LDNSVNEHDFVLGLEQNAMDSLEHGVEHFVNAEKPTDLKYTILHTFHAVELFLKARLAKGDPLSIFKNRRNNHTVDFRTSIKLLSDVGVNMSEQNRNNLDALRTIRNSIEHHQIQGNRRDIEHYLGRAMYFLDSFLQRELGINLKDDLDEDTYRVLSEALYSYNERLEKAKERVKQVCEEMERDAFFEKMPYLCERLLCEECGEETVIIPDPTSHDDKVHCFFCEARFFVETCERCGSYMLSSTLSYAKEDIDEPVICENCWNEIKYGVESD